MNLSTESYLLLVSTAALWWLAVYVFRNNTRSTVAIIVSLFLGCLSVFLTAITLSRNITNYDYYVFAWKYTEWSYIIPIALLYHFSVVVTRINKPAARMTVVIMYIFALVLIALQIFSDKLIKYNVNSFTHDIGFQNPRGELFWTIGLFVFASSVLSLFNYVTSYLNTRTSKYLYPAITSFIYLFTGPAVVWLYYQPDQSNAVIWSPALLVLPFLPAVYSIIRKKLVSDIEPIFNLKEFMYLTATIFIIQFISGTIFITQIAPLLGEKWIFFALMFIYITIITHSFYDWLSTFIRDLLYNYGKGFSLVTDNEVNDIVRNYHNSEKLEATSLARFKSVRKNNALPTDGIQFVVRDAIEYFKQPDYPRRNKQNIKYQILKMMTLDQAEEGQILWELGFEGYPMKIMSGENSTRKPLFKVESMSDYTAISRNAYISLKKEAIHDLAWRISAIERNTK